MQSARIVKKKAPKTGRQVLELKINIDTYEDHRTLVKVLPGLTNDTEQFLFENKLSLLVLLAALVCLVVLPSYRFLALSAGNIAHNMSTGRHAALYSFAMSNVDNIIEEVCFSVLASEVLRDREIMDQ